MDIMKLNQQFVTESSPQDGMTRWECGTRELSEMVVVCLDEWREWSTGDECVMDESALERTWMSEMSDGWSHLG